MTHTHRTALLGQGYQVPEHIRGNDDPIFDWLRRHPPSGGELFTGLKYRRVLARADGVVDLMVHACQDALAQAGLRPGQIDMLLGGGSVGQYLAPNDLCRVHHALGLGRDCRVMPLNSDYTTFLDGMKLAHDLIGQGSIRHALVVSGNNWTHHVDYHEAVSLAASDGAGAAVVGPSDDPRHFRLIDWINRTDTRWFGAFHLAPRPAPTAPHRDYTPALMTIADPEGGQAFKAFGLQVPGPMVQDLLARHGLSGQDITLVAHQSSQVVIDAWQQAIAPAHYVNTLADFGDMVSSSVPVNLARCFDEIRTRHLVLLGIGMEMHATALLYERD